MNKRLFLKDNFFKFKYQFFIFIFLLLFFNPLTVFAGVFDKVDYGVVDVRSLQSLQTDIDRGGKIIFSSSMELGYFHYGETEFLMKMKQLYTGGNTENLDKKKFFEWLRDTKKVDFTTDITAYGDCMIFNESYVGDPYICTGWLYLLCEDRDYLEFAATMRDLGKEGADAVPLYYKEGEDKGSIFISVPGEYFYYPVSSHLTTWCSVLDCPGHDGTCLQTNGCSCFGTHKFYLSQIYACNGAEWNKKETRISYAQEDSFKRITSVYLNEVSHGGKVHDVNDFNGAAGNGDILVYANILPAKYAWIMAFCNVDLIENLTNGIGATYINDGHTFPVSKRDLFYAVDTVWNGRGNEKARIIDYVENGENKRRFPLYSINPSEEDKPDNYMNNGATKPLVDGLVGFMRADKLWEKTRGVSEQFRGMKEIGQNHGVDGIFTGLSSLAGNMKYKDDRGTLINCEKTLENIYNYIKAETEKDENFKLDSSNIYDIYLANMEPGDGISSAFTNVLKVDENGNESDSIKVGLRYVWATGIGFVMDSSSTTMADTDESLSADINFARDTISRKWNWTNDLLRDTWTTWPTSALKKEKLTKHFSSYGNDIYNNLSDADKLKNALVIMQNHPQIIHSMASYKPYISKMLKGKTGVEAIRELNNLGKTNYEQWKKCCIAIGNELYNYSLASNVSSSGWNTSFALLRNGGSFYSCIGTGLNICQVEAAPPRVSDLVMSNSYNENESTFAYEDVSEEVQYNPTARNVIDWIHGNAGGFENGSYYGGKGSLPDIDRSKYSTILDASSNWDKFDIYSTIVQNGAIVGGLKRGNNNVIEINADTAVGAKFDDNPEKTSFLTTVFVGRTPEANPEDEILVSDIQVLAKASYNKFELDDAGNYLDFNAGKDYDASARYNFASYAADGTAITTLGGYFSSLYTDYNTSILFNIYNSTSTRYDAQNFMQIKAEAADILKANVSTYKFEDYPELGPGADGYSAITGGWKGSVGGEKFAPGDVVTYDLDYRIPSPETIEEERNRESTRGVTSLIETGQWYYEYGQILCSDVDFWIVPNAKNPNALKEFLNVNKNTNNDWVRMRIKVPVMDNMYFTETDIQGVSGNHGYLANVFTHPSGIQMAYGTESHRVYSAKIPKSDIVSGSNFKDVTISIRAKWQYWCRGRQPSEINALRQYYDYINYYNGFTLKSGTLKTTDIQETNKKTMSIGFGQGAISLTPRIDFMNAAKDKSIRLQIPNNKCNDYTDDWEVIIYNFEVPDKDNAVIDLVLKAGGQEYGDVTRANGRQHEAQQIPRELTGARVYAIVERIGPTNPSTWYEVKNGSTIHCHFDITSDDTKSNGNGLQGHLYTGGLNSYQGVAENDFCKVGQRLIYYRDVGGPFSYLSAVANYRNQKCCYDREDINMTNNYWSEIWESTKNPNFVLNIVDSQPNVQNTKGVGCGGAGCTGELEVQEPYLVFTIAQDNPNAQGTWRTYVHAKMEGVGALELDGGGVVYAGNGRGQVTFSGGDTSPRTVIATWNPIIVPYALYSKNNRTYDIEAHINYSCCLTVSEETYHDDNHKQADFTVNPNCEPPTCTPCLPRCCVFSERIHQDARVFWGAGRTYYWDVVFEWYQQNTWKTEGINVYVPHYYDGCPSVYKDVSDGAGGSYSVLVKYIEHEHCPCYCTVAYSGPNNGEKWWRNSGPSYKGLGEGKYYETWGLNLYIESTSYGEASVGTMYIYQGENFRIRYESFYNSDRRNQPKSPFAPWSQPYGTGYSGSGCPTCNWLTRRPDVRNVQGPYYVDISLSGTHDYDFFYCRISPQYGGGGPVKKVYGWKPIPDWIHVEDNQVKCQTMKMYICAYDFKGHVYDTYQALLGYKDPGYAWERRAQQVYCDSKTAYGVFCPSIAVIGSAMETEGLDTSSGGQNRHEGKVDGDIWVE